MYALSRRYRFDPANAEKIDREIQKSFVPLLKKAHGFVAYYWLDNGNGIGESMTIPGGKSGAEGSVSVAKFWVEHHLAGLLGTPEVIAGEVKAHG